MDRAAGEILVVGSRSRAVRRLEAGLGLALVCVLAAVGLAAWQRYRATEALKDLLLADANSWREGQPRPPARLERATKLLSRGGDANAHHVEHSLLTWAVRAEDVPMLELLLARGGRPAAEVMLEASRADDVRLLARLVDAGGDVNQPDGDGDLSLASAVWWNLPEHTRYLLRAGAKVNARDSSGLTALGYARRFHTLFSQPKRNAAGRHAGRVPAGFRERSLRTNAEILRLLLRHGGAE